MYAGENEQIFTLQRDPKKYIKYKNRKISYTRPDCIGPMNWGENKNWLLKVI